MDVSLVGRKVKIFFDDGNKVSFKLGILQNINSEFIEFLNDKKEIEMINSSRVVRIESYNGN